MSVMKKHIRGITVIAVLFALSIAAIVVCVGIGTIEFTPREVIRAIFTDDGSPSRLIVWNLRLPRILTGGLVGICLALSGCVLQGVMRNNLASPSTIGVTGGASFVGYLTLVAFPAYSYLLPVGSIAGAFVTTMLIYALAYERSVLRPDRAVYSWSGRQGRCCRRGVLTETLFWYPPSRAGRCRRARCFRRSLRRRW